VLGLLLWPLATDLSDFFWCAVDAVLTGPWEHPSSCAQASSPVLLQQAVYIVMYACHLLHPSSIRIMQRPVYLSASSMYATRALLHRRH
jgi:hypothetical protein